MEFILPASGFQSGKAEKGAGVTLLEAYSALAKRNESTAAVEIPFPGQPSEVDPGVNIWRLRVLEIE